MAAVISAAVILLAAILIIVNISNRNTITCDIKKGENNNVIIQTSLEKLKEKNIEYGDELQIRMSSGYFADFVPFLNGEFMNSGSHIIKAQNNESSIEFLMQDNTDFWNITSAKDNEKISIKLKEKSIYSNLNKAFLMTKLPDISNIRSLKGGNLKYLSIFRGCSSNTSSAKVNFAVNAFKSQLKINSTCDLNNSGINFVNIKSKDNNTAIINELKKLASTPDRIYICSNEDDDATAYYCAILEAIAGASYEQIVDDYMETYKNYYGITKDAYPEQYEAIKKYHIDKFLRTFSDSTDDYDLSKIDFSDSAEFYLRSHKASEEEISLIKSRLINN